MTVIAGIAIWLALYFVSGLVLIAMNDWKMPWYMGGED